MDDSDLSTLEKGVRQQPSQPSSSRPSPIASSAYPPPPRPQTALERHATAKKGKGKQAESSPSTSSAANLLNGAYPAQATAQNTPTGSGIRPFPADEDAEDAGPAGMSFNIRFTEGQEDLLDLWVGEKESVREVKRRIRFLRPALTDNGRPRRLRLIQLGRLLTDGTYLVPYTVKLVSRRAKLVKQQAQGNAEVLFDGAMQGLEAVGREIGVTVPGNEGDEDGKGKGKGPASASSKGKGKAKESDNWDKMMSTAGGVEEDDKTVWLHCSVGEPMDDDEIEGERVQTTQLTPLKGFDRLREAGFTEEDIASMREEFRANSAANNGADGDDDEHARALEDQWMEGLGQGEVANDSVSSGNFTTTLQGLCLGFFVPFLPLFFFRTQLFSKDLQISIFLGLMMNIAFGAIRLLN
ncbi:hypothetical protein T439DRAFT_378013 [Meredithblackwellia eburnea MCA 4105]